MRKYEIDFTDPGTGATSPIDTYYTYEGEEPLTAESYIKNVVENADSEYAEMVMSGEITVIEVESDEDKDLNDYSDDELIEEIDSMSEWNEDSMNELILRANIYDEESGIKGRWESADGECDIQCFFDEACEIIRAFHERS